ncbi:MAG TPA: glycosyltransferase family 39 protein [Thermoanaerobaculia bacterium]|jgi:4-amino-4-deoxy-L-arabinose transferase-like glycosyltransferase|nr:glycosyltransferase family 39 protein [Thermoanaerobaculia bacterium]
MLRIAIVLAIALRVFLILVVAPNVFRVDDSLTYTTGAQSIATRGSFLDATGKPEIFRTPGYPLVLAPLIASHASDAAIVALNIVFAVLIVIVTWRIARQLFADDRVAGICALIVAIEPTMLTWSLKVMPETLFTLCLVLFAYAAIRELPVAAGVALGAAIYVKPIAWPLALIVPLVAVWFRPKRALILFATCAALLAPWHVRNYVTAGYVGFSSLIDRSIYITAGGSVAARQQGVPFLEMRRQLIARDNARAGDAARYAEMRREGASRIASDPFGWAKTHITGMFRTLFDPGAVEYPRMLGLYTSGGQAALAGGGVRAAARAYPFFFWLSIVWALALLPLVLLPIAGAFRVPANSRLPFALFALITVYLVVAGGGVPGYHRFRVPAVPFLVLMSAFAYTAQTCSSPSSPPARSPQPSES